MTEDSNNAVSSSFLLDDDSRLNLLSENILYCLGNISLDIIGLIIQT